MKTSKICVILLSLVGLCCATFCTEPVKQFQVSNINITLKGPCPSHTDPLLISVGDTMIYECEYQFPNTVNYVPLWNISGFSDSPYPFGFNSPPSNIIITEEEGSTTFFEFNVIEIESIRIQCGLCQVVDCSMEPLKNNIVSEPVTLVVFGSPQPLTHHRDRDTVLLTWSSPVFASKYSVEFQYEVILINNNSQVITYNITNNTSLNISREDIPDNYDVCSQYYWSVRSVVEERKSVIVEANEAFFILAAPNITSGLEVNIQECIDDITIMLNITVQSFESAENLNFDVLIIEDNITVFYESLVPVYSSNDKVHIVLVVMDRSLDSLLNSSIIVNVSNECGYDESEYQILEDMDISSCPPSPSPSTSPSLSTSLSLPIVSMTSSTSVETITSTTFNTISFTPTVAMKSRSSNINPFYIAVGVILFVILIIIIIIIIVIILIYMKRRKKKFNIINGTRKETINRNEHEMVELVQLTKSNLTPSDYLTPFDATDAKKKYLTLQQQSTDSSNTQVTSDQINPTYSTPDDIRRVPVIQQTVNNSEYAEVVQTSETKQNTLQQNLPITDTPGYSTPLSQVPGNPPEPTYSTPEHAIHPPSTLTSHVPRNTSPFHDVVDTPGYTEVPAPFKKTGSKRGSKRKQGSTKSPSRQGSMRSPKSPLPPLPTDVPLIPTMVTGALETDSSSNSHLYADINEIQNKKHQGKNTTYVNLELSDPTNPTPSSQQRSETTYSTIAKQT